MRRCSRGSPGTDCEPTFHLTLITRLTLPSTPATLILLANARPVPARTPDTTVTPGTERSAVSEAVEIGEKLFVAVSA